MDFQTQEDVMFGEARVIGPYIYLRDARKQLTCLLLDDGYTYWPHDSA